MKDVKTGLEVVFKHHDRDGVTPKIDSLESAFAAAYMYLIDRGEDPLSEGGRNFLTQVTSSAGQHFDGYPPLPGTKSNAELSAEIQARKKIG